MADIGQTHQALRELDNVSTSSGRGTGQAEDSRTCRVHRLFDTQLRYQTHDLDELRDSHHRIFAKVFLQGIVYLYCRLNEGFQALDTVVAETELTTNIGQFVKFGYAGTGINLSQITVKLVNIAHGQARYLTDICQLIAHFAILLDNLFELGFKHIKARKDTCIGKQILHGGTKRTPGTLLTTDSTRILVNLCLNLLHIVYHLHAARVFLAHLLKLALS